KVRSYFPQARCIRSNTLLDPDARQTPDPGDYVIYGSGFRRRPRWQYTGEVVPYQPKATIPQARQRGGDSQTAPTDGARLEPAHSLPSTEEEGILRGVRSRFRPLTGPQSF